MVLELRAFASSSLEVEGRAADVPGPARFGNYAVSVIEADSATQRGHASCSRSSNGLQNNYNRGAGAACAPVDGRGSSGVATVAKQIVSALGLMSGTSADGVDVALLRTDGEAKIEFCGGLTLPYQEELRARLLEASQHDVKIAELLRVEHDLTLHHAEAVRRFLAEVGGSHPAPTVVGFHGHTVRHLPDESLTMQIGNPWLLAEQIGMPVVWDFRRHDIARGGQGAPLVALFHRYLFHDQPRPVAILNLGGVANLTWLGEDDQILAGDIGPGCGLLDEWAQEMAGAPHDQDGRLAQEGKVHKDVLKSALSAPFFSRPIPKSADRYDFDHIDVSMLSVEDGAATLCAVTAQAVVNAEPRLPAKPNVLWVTGGGVHHPVIMQMLAEHFDEVRSVQDLDLSPDTLEAECFAWLAVRHQRGLPLTIPETTGCQEPLCGGFHTC